MLVWRTQKGKLTEGKVIPIMSILPKLFKATREILRGLSKVLLNRLMSRKGPCLLFFIKI